VNYRDLVFATLKPLNRGSLTLSLPDGSAYKFGGLGKDLDAQINITNPDFFKRCVLAGAIGFAESYIQGDWESPHLPSVIAFFTRNAEFSPVMKTRRKRIPPALDFLSAYNRYLHLRRPNSIKKSRSNIGDHYDVSNDFFALWLDPSMTYSSAVFDPLDLDLEEAQQKKYNVLCRKLRLTQNDHLLEVGTGWGGLSLHAAKHFGCRVTTTTISEEQHHEAKRRIEEAGLANRVTVLLEDYRHLSGKFDKIISIEMIEAVGDAYVDNYFGILSRLLRPSGLLGLQAILCPDQQYEILRRGVDFIQKHIFPGSLLMSLQRILKATSRTDGLNLLSYDDYGPDYAKTLRIWREAFEDRRSDMLQHGLDEQFIRKWRYYLAYCEAAFATRFISVAQLVFTNSGNLALNWDSPISDQPWALPRG